MKNAYMLKISILLQFGGQTFGTETKLGFVWSHQGITELISRPQIAIVNSCRADRFVCCNGRIIMLGYLSYACFIRLNMPFNSFFALIKCPVSSSVVGPTTAKIRNKFCGEFLSSSLSFPFLFLVDHWPYFLKP